MKVLVISYGINEYDGRLQELIHVMENLGAVELCCCTKNNTSGLHQVEGAYLSGKNYLKFCQYVLRKVKGKKYDLVLSDNLFAALPALLVKWLKRPRYVVQDVRELYFAEKLHGKGKIFAWFERILMKKADIVLCANEERAEIMEREFKLKKRPMVFENIRFLAADYDEAEMDKKYEGIFKYEYNLVSTSGLFMARDTDKLIEAMKDLDDRFGLFFVGSSSDADVATMNRIMETHGIKNVHLIGRVPMTELVYIVRKCQMGMVHYHKRNLNNKFCASGKIYEFLHEGLPIVTTENPPLKKMCDAYGIGIADDRFAPAVQTIAQHYEEYQKRVADFVKDVSVEAYNQKIAAQICGELEVKVK